MPSSSPAAPAACSPKASAVPDASRMAAPMAVTRLRRDLGSLITIFSPSPVDHGLWGNRAGRADPDLGQHAAVAGAAPVVQVAVLAVVEQVRPRRRRRGEDDVAALPWPHVDRVGDDVVLRPVAPL